MQINLYDGNLILTKENTQLRSNHKSQLKAWGFKNKDETFVLYDCGDETLNKLISYLDNRNIQYKLDELAVRKLNNYKRMIKGNKDKLELLRRYKEGIIDTQEINEHSEFLRTLNRKLKEHQVKASLHLYLAKNAANFSVPGSGKTTVVLSVYERLKKEGIVDALFVIGPLSCFGSWKEEFFQTLGRKPKTTILAGGDPRSRVGQYYNYTEHSELYLTSFQTNMMDHEHTKKFMARVKTFLVVDEAHYIKRLDGEWSDAVLDIADNAKRRVALTGTPMPKGFSDIFNLVDFLYPCYQYLDGNSKNLLKNYQETNSCDDAKILIENKVGSLFYRVRKNELKLKKQVFNDPLIIKMNKYEKKIYDAIVTKIVEYSDRDYLRNIDLVNKLIRGRMIRLRQCASYAGLLSSSIEEYEENLIEDDSDLAEIIANYDNYEEPAKLTRIISMIDGLLSRKEKVIIWSNFIGTISLIEKTLHDKGIYCKKIIGATPVEREVISIEETREKIRNEFVDPNSDLFVLLANPAACAESISLHICCNNAIYYDLSYNCAQYLQSLDRIHRVGGSEKIEAYYYFLQYSNTIDSDILDNLTSKADRMRIIIDDEYEIYNLDMFDGSDEINAYNRLFRND